MAEMLNSTDALNIFTYQGPWPMSYIDTYIFVFSPSCSYLHTNITRPELKQLRSSPTCQCRLAGLMCPALSTALVRTAPNQGQRQKTDRTNSSSRAFLMIPPSSNVCLYIEPNGGKNLPFISSRAVLISIFFLYQPGFLFRFLPSSYLPKGFGSTPLILIEMQHPLVQQRGTFVQQPKLLGSEEKAYQECPFLQQVQAGWRLWDHNNDTVDIIVPKASD